jgi:hypothetical protein
VTVPPAETTTTAQSCQSYFAGRTFLYAKSATLRPDGSLTIVAEPTTVVCGGPDDYHYSEATTTETAVTAPNAAIGTFSISQMADVAISASALPSYLAHGPELGVFRYIGPLNDITSLQEQFHP